MNPPEVERPTLDTKKRSLQWHDHRRMIVLFVVFLCSVCSVGRLAQADPPRLEDIFKSTQEELGDRVDGGKVLAFVCAAAGVVVLLMVLGRVKQRQDTPHALNHPGKLIRELQREISLKPAEVRQLKALAENTPVSNPLTLLLCPSLLAKAAKENPDRVDHRILAGIVKRSTGK